MWFLVQTDKTASDSKSAHLHDAAQCADDLVVGAKGGGGDRNRIIRRVDGTQNDLVAALFDLLDRERAARLCIDDRRMPR